MENPQKFEIQIKQEDNLISPQSEDIALNFLESQAQKKAGSNEQRHLPSLSTFHVIRRQTRLTTKEEKSLKIIQNEYFTQDLEENMKMREELITPQNFTQIRDHEVQFEWRIFLEVLLIHVFFYVLFGPLSIIFFNQKPGLFLLRNFAFVGNQFYFYFQNFLYFFNIFSIITYFTSQTSNLYQAEIVYLILTMFLRCFVIACKYSTLHPDKFKLYQQHKLTNQITGMDFFFRHWALQDDFIIHREGSQSLMRAEVDNSLFYISFFKEPSKDVKLQLEEFNNDIRQQHTAVGMNYQNKTLNKLRNQEMFYGFGIFKYIINHFNSKNGMGRFTLYATTLAMTRSLVPVIFRVITGQIINNSTLDVIQMVGMVFNTLVGYWSSYLFLIFYIRDLQRKKYFQKQSVFMISPTKKYFKSETKLLPTINFLNSMTLKGWSILRRMGIDYGRRFSLRLEVFMTTIVLVNTVSILIVVLWLFRIYELTTIYLVIAGYEIITVSVLFFIIIIKGAFINQHFQKFDNILTDHLILCDTLRSLREEYFQTNIIPSNYIKIQAIEKIQTLLEFNNTSGIIDQSMERNLTRNLSEKNTPEITHLIDNFLDDLIISLTDLQRELKQDDKNFSYTFLGFKITLTHVFSIFISLATILSVSMQNYLLSSNDQNI